MFLNSSKVIICNRCGDENSLDSKVCHSCGVKLDKSKITTGKIEFKSNVADQPKVEKPKTKKQGKPQNKNKNESTAVPEKKLESKKIFALIGASAAVVVLILVASGVIDISGNKPVSREVIQQNQSSGIDLSAITKINELKNIVEKNPDNAAAILDLANLAIRFRIL